MEALHLVRRIASGISSGRHPLRCLAAILLLLGPVCLSASVDVPARPANYLLDQGEVFSPESAGRIADALKACARDYDVHVYVMTVPTLKVMPSRARETLEEMLKATQTQWLGAQVGVVIIFDDEAGWVTMAASDEAKRVFSPVALNMLFRDPQLQSKKKRNAPEKLAGTVTLVIQHMTDLRTKANEEFTRRRATNLVFGVIVGGVILPGVLVFFVKRGSRPAPQSRRHRVQVHV